MTTLSLAAFGLLGASAFHVAAPTAAPTRPFLAPRVGTPVAKLVSREQLDFTKDHGTKDFGLEGNVLGLAPKADSGGLLFLAIWVARRHRLPIADLLFAGAFPAYLMLANAVRFDSVKRGLRKFKPLLREGRGPWFKRYVLSYALVGLVLPLPVVAFAPAAIGQAAAPHLFLTAVQCAVEGLTAHARFAALLRLAVPVGFNAYRMHALGVWCTSALATARSSAVAGTWLWAWPALALAVTSSVMWTYNLLVFLLLRVAPQYLDAEEFPTPPAHWRGSLVPVVSPADAEE